MRAISLGLLLAGVLTFETLAMSQVFRSASAISAQPVMTLDPGQFFQCLSQP